MLVPLLVFLAVGVLSLLALFLAVRKTFRRVVSLGRTVAAAADRLATATDELGAVTSVNAGRPDDDDAWD
ncbi:MAG: hypothetical protein LC640_04540 [Frankia sp.]|nr:hypothetical protein [Frankia sp.]